MKKSRPETVLRAQEGPSRQALDLALKISQKRRGYLDAMRKAIRAGDKDAVFELARKLTGLSDEAQYQPQARPN